jgi:serine/threonine-protein kinase RIO1
MLLLHKLIASGRLGGVGGVVKEGKESVVFRGEGWSEEVHRELAGEGWSGVKAQVWEGDEEEEDESEGEGPAEEGEEEEEGEGTAEGEAEAASAAPSAATGSAAAVSGTAPSAAKAAVPADSSDLYSEFTSGGVSDVAVKVFKTTLNEFSNRKAYMDGDRRFSRTKLSQDPRKVVPLWAEKEFTNLIRVHRAGIPSPAPLLLREHVMVMEFLGADGWPAPQLREAGLRSLAAWSNAYLQVVSIMSALYKVRHRRRQRRQQAAEVCGASP